MSVLSITRPPVERVVDRALGRAKPAIRWGLVHGLPRRVLRRAADAGDLQSTLAVEAQNLMPEELAPLFQRIRDRGPVAPGKFAYVTVDHAAVHEVLTSGSFRTGFPGDQRPLIARVSEWTKREKLHPVLPPSLLVTEGADHTRYRKLVTRVFTARAVEQLRERTEVIASGLLDDLTAASGPVDLVESYCAQLPVAVISEILGVPDAERAEVLRLGELAAASLDMGVDWGTFCATEQALDEFDDWLGMHLQRLRENPGDDLFSKLVAAGDGEGGLTERELRSTAGLVLAAGFETTVNLLGNAVRLLADHPDQLERLRAEPQMWGSAVDEVLRFDPPVLLTGRTAVRDVDVEGVRVRAGSMVVAVLAGANRDPKVFEKPDTFDVTRPNAREHMAFSAGKHFCLGAALARMEGEVALRALHDRFDVEVLAGARRRSTRILRGYETLPVRLTAR